MLIERSDVSVVIVWRIAGSNEIGEQSSTRMGPDERRRRIAWCAQHLLEMQIEPTWISKLFPFSTR
jgi:hypothetical protein